MSKVRVLGRLQSIAEAATTDLHVLHNGAPLFDSVINLEGKGPRAEFAARHRCQGGRHARLRLRLGQSLTTVATPRRLAVTVKSRSGKAWDAARDFSIAQNPNGAWSYGTLKPADKPDSRTFTLFPDGRARERPSAASAIPARWSGKTS